MADAAEPFGNNSTFPGSYWVPNPPTQHFEEFFTPNALCYYADYTLRLWVNPYASEWYEDWKLWLGLLLTVVFKVSQMSMHIHEHAILSEHPAWDQLFKLGKKVGSNFVLLHLLQYHNPRATVRRLMFPLVMLPSIGEKLFLFSFGNKAKKYNLADISVNSIYMRFEDVTFTDNGSSALLFKTVVTFLLQFVLLVLYWSSVVSVCGPFAYLFWLVSLLVQTSGELSHMFGETWDYRSWRFIFHNAGNITLRRDDDEIRKTQVAEVGNEGKYDFRPTACAIYSRFAASVVVELMGRNMIIDTLPVFLMASETSIDFCLNCVATGFFMQLSMSSATYKVVSTDSEGSCACEDSEESTLIEKETHAA